jgi:hypothetical protein
MIFLRLKGLVRLSTLLRQDIGKVLILADSDIRVVAQATCPPPFPIFFKDVK